MDTILQSLFSLTVLEIFGERKGRSFIVELLGIEIAIQELAWNDEEK